MKKVKKKIAKAKKKAIKKAEPEYFIFHTYNGEVEDFLSLEEMQERADLDNLRHGESIVVKGKRIFPKIKIILEEE